MCVTETSPVRGGHDEALTLMIQYGCKCHVNVSSLSAASFDTHCTVRWS